MSRDALVVGINTYQYLPSLKAPARDAEAIAQQLHTYGEFRVQRLPEVIQAGKPQVGQKTQITLRELETALINLFKPKGSSVPQTAVFYFSGHGIQREAGIREGYLALSDSNPDKGFFGLSLFWLRRLLQESPVRQRIIVLDCCHSGELLNFLEADPGAHPGTDRLFMAASREYETAYESLESPYSVFTEALVTGLDPNRLASGIVTNHSLTDWVNHALKGEIQQPLFESSGSEIILTRQNPEALSISSPDPSAAQSKDICPYRGLEVFDETHAEYFFGREDLTAQLLQKLSKKQFVAVVGASGSGKSSLVRAGLIAQLRQGKKVAGSDQWKIKLITPTHQPLKSLAAAFIDPDSSDLERAEQLRRAETFLQDGGVGLAQLIRASLPITANSTGLPSEQRPRFLLVVDQFEEVFTLSHGSQAERERQEFFDCLVGALAAAQEVFSVVIALRADFLNKCSNYEGLTQQISQNHVMVAPLKYEQIKSTIVKPAQKVGLVCEPNLVYTMMADIIGAPGELPLLQYTLSELWRRRRVGTGGGVSRLTLDAYQGLGGVRGTLQKRATEVFHNLSVEEQAVARRIFLALTQLGEGTEDTRRRVVKSELVSPTSPMGLVNQVLEKLVAAKLVMTSQESTELSELAASEGQSGSPASTPAKQFSQEIVDVAHEALIRNWSLLRTWLDESREMLRRQRRIEQAAQEWHHVGQPINGEYLLYGFRLRDAEDFLKQHPQELSDVAHHYIDVSYANCRRARQRSQRLQLAIPSVLVATLTIVLNQYYGTLRTRTEQDNQLQKAMVRERAAVVQAVLKDANADPMTALLISRLAAEGGDASYEAQSSLRAALQNLRLQSELQGHEGEVPQVVFSPNRQHLATAGADGKIRLWTVNAGTIYNTSFAAEKVLSWSEADPSASNPSASQPMIRSIVFSPDGQQIAATVEDSPMVKVWSVESGKLRYQLGRSAAATSAVKQISYSPTGEWLVTLGKDQSISVWQAETGTLKAQMQSSSAINHLELSADGRSLLLSGEDGTAQLRQLTVDASGTLNLNQEKAFIHADVVYQAKFAANDQWVVTLGKDGKVRLWDRRTGQVRRTLPETASPETASPETAKLSNDRSQKPVKSATASPLIKQMWLSPDQQTLATLDFNHHVSLWNMESGELQAKLVSENAARLDRGNSTVERLEFSPNGRLVVTTTPTAKNNEGHTAYLWDSQTGQRIGKLSGHQSKITAAQFSPDGTYVVTASADGKVRLWATELGGELPAVHLGNDAVEWISFLPSSLQKPNSTVSSASSNSTKASGRLNSAIADASVINSHLSTDQASGLALNLNQSDPSQHARQLGQTSVAQQDKSSETAVTHMLTVGAGGQLQRWQILTDTSTQPAIPPVNSDAPAKTDHYLASIRPQAIAELKGKLITFAQTRSFNWRNTAPSITPGFATVAQLPSLQTFAQSGKPIPLPNNFAVPETETLSGFATSPDGKLFATADIEGWVRVYQIQAEQPLKLLYRVQNWRRVEGQTHPVSKIDQGLNQEVASQAVGNTALTSEQQSTQATSLVQAPEGVGDPVAIRHLTFSPDGKQILGIADDLTMRSWETASGKLIQVFQGHEATIRQVRYSPDGQSIVSASWDRTARIWQTATGQTVKTFPHEDAVSSASFSPDGQQVVTTSWNGTAQIWQLNKNKPQVLLNKHQKSVLDAQFSPDGRLLVTASLDGTARLWDAVTGEEQSQLRSQGGEGILQAAFSPDGQYVATLTKSGKVHLWGATWEMLLQLARERSSRQLTPEECSQYLRLPANQCPQLPVQN